MEAKLEIIQRLLDNHHITAKEAMILMEKEKEYINISPMVYPRWYGEPIPCSPASPFNPLPVQGTGDPVPKWPSITCKN